MLEGDRQTNLAQDKPLGLDQRSRGKFRLRRNNSGYGVNCCGDEMDWMMGYLHLDHFLKNDEEDSISAGICLASPQSIAPHREQQQEYGGPYQDTLGVILTHRLKQLPLAEMN